MRHDNVDVPGHKTVRSVVKATHLLLAVAESESGGLTATQAADRIGIPLPTAYHLLNTLLAEGMLSRDSERRYYLGPKVASLSLAYERSGPSERLLLAAHRLAQLTGETAYVSGWRKGDVVALASIEGSKTVRVGQIHMELRGYEYARASGKVLLSHLNETSLDSYLARTPLVARTGATIVVEDELRRHLEVVRQQGYAVDEAELDVEIGCVAAPIIEGGTCIAGIGLSAPLGRFRDRRDELIATVKAVAAEISNPGDATAIRYRGEAS